MEMHQVRYFLAVSQHLNFTRAAEACNVSQPSLTRAIKLLEDELGGALFHRERANTYLSELGQVVQPHLRQVYDEAHAVRHLAKDFTKLKKARLKIGIMCTIAPTLLIDLIKSIRERHAGIDVEIRDANAHKIDKQLLEGKLEAAIYCIPGKEPDPRLHTLPLFREQMMIVVAQGHRFAAQNAVRIKDLDGENYLSRSSCEFNGYADRYFEEQAVQCNTVYQSDRDDWVLAMVRARLGFGFMPSYCVTDAEVIARPLVEPEMWRDVNLVTVRGRPHSPAVGALVREAMRIKWHGAAAIAVAGAAERREEEIVSH